jgi:hypothetical protein
MNQKLVSNLYQDRFLRLIENGELSSESIIKLTHRYLDGKPAKSGGQSLSATDRDLHFWMANFWEDIPDEVFASEAFALALARYLQQIKVTRPDWLQHVAAKSPHAFRRAIRYSQIFLSPTGLRWKEIIGLDLDGSGGLPDFIKACAILQNDHRRLKSAIKSIEAELKRLTPMEMLVYASLFAFKHIVYRLGQQELRPEQLDKDRADADRADFQKITEAINHILISKLKTSIHSDFFISERIIGESLRKHMSSILFPTPSTARAAEKCLLYFDTFERLVAAYRQFNGYIDKTINSFCFDEDYDIRFEGERLILYPRVNPEGYEWGRNGKKLEQLHQYWHFRAVEEFIKSGLAFERFGSPENEESNRFAWISAIRTQLELTEVYGLDDEITTESGYKIDVLQALLTIELMHAFYKQGYILPYCRHREQMGDWLSALTVFSFAGLIEGENRFPLTFAERNAKIARICNWTSSEEYPDGDPQLTEAILDFWSNDLRDLSRLLREHEHALVPELYERPIFKIGNYFFQLPWVFAFQNNVTAAVNNLRRLGRNRAELNSETNRIEKRLAETFEHYGFNVLVNFQPSREADDEIGEIDLICFRDDHLFIFEIKSGYLRKTQRDAWQHRTNTLRKAALQLKRKSAWVTERLTTDPRLSVLIGGRNSNRIQIHCWIIDTSIEQDHEYFEGFLKVSLQEIIIALRNERHLLRDLQRAITEEKQKRNGDCVDATEFRNICAEAMMAIHEQSAEDNLYPNGFKADQFAAVIEIGVIWEVLDL